MALNGKVGAVARRRKGGSRTVNGVVQLTSDSLLIVK